MRADSRGSDDIILCLTLLLLQNHSDVFSIPHFSEREFESIHHGPETRKRSSRWVENRRNNMWYLKERGCGCYIGCTLERVQQQLSIGWRCCSIETMRYCAPALCDWGMAIAISQILSVNTSDSITVYQKHSFLILLSIG